MQKGIYTVNVDDTHMIEEVYAGIEEEGLLYEVNLFTMEVLMN